MRLLEVVGLTKRFAGVTALDAVSFTAREGQTLCLVGPGGAGKTACLDCLAGLVWPDGGRIILDGREVTGDSPRRMARAGVARAAQVPRPFRVLTLAQTVSLALACGACAQPAAPPGIWRRGGLRRRALAALDRVGLASQADRRAGTLGAGPRRRLELARALALEPRLLLLDEPLGALPPGEMAILTAVVADLRAGGLTVILAERRLSPAAAALMDRVVVLDRGAMIASGRPEQVRSDPRVSACLPAGVVTA